jgi:hypothetical protein
MSWVDYDPAKRRLVKNPQLPSWAIPKKKVQSDAPYVSPDDASGEDDVVHSQPQQNNNISAAEVAQKDSSKEELPYPRLDKRLAQIVKVEDGNHLLKIAKGCDEFLVNQIPGLVNTNECVELLEKELDTAKEYFHDLNQDSLALGFMKLKAHVRSQC